MMPSIMMTASRLQGTRRRFGFLGGLGRPPFAMNPSAFTMDQTCIHQPVYGGGGAADIFGGSLATSPTPGVMCPTQPVLTHPGWVPPGGNLPSPGGTAATTGSGEYAPGVVNDGSPGGGADVPVATMWPSPGAMTAKKWVPWAIGGGILAALGAAAVALTHR